MSFTTENYQVHGGVIVVIVEGNIQVISFVFLVIQHEVYGHQAASDPEGALLLAT
jgi:hypothetical protein